MVNGRRFQASRNTSSMLRPVGVGLAGILVALLATTEPAFGSHAAPRAVSAQPASVSVTLPPQSSAPAPVRAASTTTTTISHPVVAAAPSTTTTTAAPAQPGPQPLPTPEQVQTTTTTVCQVAWMDGAGNYQQYDGDCAQAQALATEHDSLVTQVPSTVTTGAEQSVLKATA